MENPVIILGAKSTGKVAYDIFMSNNVLIYCFLDDDKSLHGSLIGEIGVHSYTEDEGYLKYVGNKCEAFVATDDNRLRKNLVKMLKEKRKVMPINAIHARATVEQSATLGHGNLISAHVWVGSFANVGNACIINAGALIENEAQIDDFVQIGAGSVIGAGVQIGEGVFVGAGATIIAGVKIGKNASIGAGSLVIANVEDNTTVFGVPAQEVRK